MAFVLVRSGTVVPLPRPCSSQIEKSRDNIFHFAKPTRTRTRAAVPVESYARSFGTPYFRVRSALVFGLLYAVGGCFKHFWSFHCSFYRVPAPACFEGGHERFLTYVAHLDATGGSPTLLKSIHPFSMRLMVFDATVSVTFRKAQGWLCGDKSIKS